MFDPWSNALKALDSGNISTGEYYYNAGMNIASFGVYSQENAFYAWRDGQITDDEMQQIIGGTAVWQGIPGALKYGPKTFANLVPKSNTIPRSQYPKPPGWNEGWGWEPASGEEYAPQWRWWDTEGGEWRYHYPDKYHPEGHWDYNPWNHPTSPWQNVPDTTSGVTPPSVPSPNLPGQ